MRGRKSLLWEKVNPSVWLHSLHIRCICVTLWFDYQCKIKLPKLTPSPHWSGPTHSPSLVCSQMLNLYHFLGMKTWLQQGFGCSASIRQWAAWSGLVMTVMIVRVKTLHLSTQRLLLYSTPHFPSSLWALQARLFGVPCHHGHLHINCHLYNALCSYQWKLGGPKF